MDKYIPCSLCKYKVLLEYQALQKLAVTEKIDFLDFVCRHCKKEILHKHDEYNIGITKHVVSLNNSIKTTPSVTPSIPLVTQHDRDDKYQYTTYSPTKKLQKLIMVKLSDSKESVATYDTIKMQEELQKVCAGLTLKEGIKGKNKTYVLKQIRDSYEKLNTRTGYDLSKQKHEHFRFWFPEKDLDKSKSIEYTKNRSSTEIIKDMFEKKGVENIKAKHPLNIAQPIGDGDWSTKIAKKYATNNKLKCIDMKSFEIFDQNNDRQIKTTNMDGKDKDLDNADESPKYVAKTITTDKQLPKRQSGIQQREKALRSISAQKTKLIQKPKVKKEKKQTTDKDSKSLREGKKGYKIKKLKDTLQTFDETDGHRLKNDTRSIGEDYEQELVTEIESEEHNMRGQKKSGDGEGDELENARERNMQRKDKALKSKEEKGKVSKICVREQNISYKKQSVLEEIIKRFEAKNTPENFNPEEVFVSKIDVRHKKRGVKVKTIQVKLSDKNKNKDTELDITQGDQEVPKGTTRYALSDRKYIDKGWTKLPTEKTARKMLLYKMKPSHPEFDWFNRHKQKKQMFYNTGEKLADFAEEEGTEGDRLKEGNGDKEKKKNKMYYRNGNVALEHYVPDEENNERRIVVYSKGEPDASGRSRPPTVLATFDHLGNGVVYDHDGNVRLKYNQTEGVLLDKTVGPNTHWKWHALNDQPELKDIMTETALVPKDMNIAKLGKPSELTKVRDEEIQAIAMENFIKSKRKQFKPHPVKMKVVKINEHFSLKVVDQATIYLKFKDHPINMKTNIGLVLDQNGKVDTELYEIGGVSSDADNVPRTASTVALQLQRVHVQRLQRKRFERERLLRLKESSIDRLYAGVSKPKTHKVITVNVDKACQCDLLSGDQFICI